MTFNFCCGKTTWCKQIHLTYSSSVQHVTQLFYLFIFNVIYLFSFMLLYLFFYDDAKDKQNKDLLAKKYHAKL